MVLEVSEKSVESSSLRRFNINESWVMFQKKSPLNYKAAMLAAVSKVRAKTT